LMADIVAKDLVKHLLGSNYVIIATRPQRLQGDALATCGGVTI